MILFIILHVGLTRVLPGFFASKSPVLLDQASYKKPGTWKEYEKLWEVIGVKR
jgi:uncharacterized iron-regulated protein